MEINILKEKIEKIITKIKKIDKDYVIIGVIVIAVIIFMIINLGKIKEFENKDNDKITPVFKKKRRNYVNWRFNPRRLQTRFTKSHC